MTGRIFLAASEYSVSEREPFVTVTFKREGDTSGAVNITYGINANTATVGLDYAGTGGVATIAAGATSVSIRIPIVNDTLAEATERFNVSLINVDSGLLLFPRTANISVLDDELVVDPPANPPQTSPYTTTSVEAVTGLSSPMHIEWLPGSESLALVSEKAGRIKVVDVSTGEVKSTLLDLTAKVNEDADRGLYDVALHPDLDAHPYLYAFYVVDPPDTAQYRRYADANGQDGLGNRYSHLVRYELDLSGELPVIKAGTETILLGAGGQSLSDISGAGALDFTDPIHAAKRASDIDPTTGLYKEDYIKVDSRSHAGGSLAFGPDGALYVSTGDGTSFNFADPRTASVQDPNSLAGKILRIDPLTGQGLADNPFATSDLDANTSKVWQMGLRNPYAITFSEDGRIIVSETGWFSWEEINSGGAGANYGWPYFEGGDGGELIRTPSYRDLPGASAFYQAVADGTIVVTSAYRAFSHASSDPGFQMSAIVGGVAVYDGDKYPAALKGDYFFSDIVDGDIFTVDVNDRTQLQYLTTVGPYKAATFSQGPDGYIYYSDLSSGSIMRLEITDPAAEENESPVVANPIADAGAEEGQALSLTLAANVFSDPNGDTLELVATLASGAPLPSWLSFDPATRTFTGTVPAAAVGALNIVVTAIDPQGAHAEDAFVLTIAPDEANVAPYVAQAVSHQTAAPGTAFAFTLPAATFADPDGDALTLTATLANGSPLPAWLTFDPATGLFSGSPAPTDVGTVLVTVAATDSEGARTSDVFAISVKIADPPPELVTPLGNQEGEAGQPLAFVIADGAFVDAGPITYTATLANGAALPAWLVFDAATGQFTGTPPAGPGQRLAITVTATDLSGSSVTDSFSLTIREGAPNTPPVVATPIADQTVAEEEGFTFTIPPGTFLDPDGDAIALTATLAGGAPLPAWLTFNAATRTFSGTPDDPQVGTLSIEVRASDGSGSVADVFVLTVTPVNDVPVVALPIPDGVATQGVAFGFVVAATAFTDVDGDTLTYAATLANGDPLPSWLVFDPATRSFAGTPQAGDVGTTSVRVTASDGKGGTASDVFNVRVDASNTPPVVANPIADQGATEQSPFSFVLPANVFADGDGDTLSLVATLANGNPLPAWLVFSPATRSFTGTPDDADIATLTIRVTASDGRGGSAVDSFELTIAPVNDAPVLAVPVADNDTTVNSPFTFVVPAGTFTDIDSPPPVLSAALEDGSPLPSWLSFNAATRTFSGTPTDADAGTLNVRITATDTAGATVSDVFVLTVEADDPEPTQTLYQETAANQYLTATSEYDVFVLNGASSQYSWGPTESGDGVVIWNAAGFDILFGFEELRFTNRSVMVSSVIGSDNPDFVDDPTATQHISGKTALDRFVIDGDSSDYGWGATESGQGVVIWSVNGSAAFDVLNGFERIVFNDQEVDISGIGTV